MSTKTEWYATHYDSDQSDNPAGWPLHIRVAAEQEGDEIPREVLRELERWLRSNQALTEHCESGAVPIWVAAQRGGRTLRVWEASAVLEYKPSYSLRSPRAVPDHPELLLERAIRAALDGEWGRVADLVAAATRADCDWPDMVREGDPCQLILSESEGCCGAYERLVIEGGKIRVEEWDDPDNIGERWAVRLIALDTVDEVIAWVGRWIW